MARIMSDEITLTPTERILEKYGITKNGFLPAELPLARFPDTYYAPWENIIQNLPSLVSSGAIRQRIDRLQVLETTRLDSEAEWRRAYLVLAFLTQAYIWGGEKPADRLPRSISQPMLKVSTHLDLPPVSTYAALNLWNFTSDSSSGGLADLGNLSTLHTITGSPDESWFFVISVAVEACGAPIISTMLRAFEAVDSNDAQVIIDALRRFTTTVGKMSTLLERMDEKCDPDFFYHRIRPFLAGSRNMEAAGLPSGIFYEEEGGGGRYRTFRGGSNAQSPIIQFLDLVLGVDHTWSEAPENGSARNGCTSAFHAEMRSYMSGPHRDFLNFVAKTANIRDYVKRSTSNAALTDAYNAAVYALTSFRDKHIALVTRYIIIPAKKSSTVKNSGLNLAVASSKISESGDRKKELRGTGGTVLIPFLKQARDGTSATVVDVSKAPFATG